MLISAVAVNLHENHEIRGVVAGILCICYSGGFVNTGEVRRDAFANMWLPVQAACIRISEFVDVNSGLHQ